MQLYFGRFAAAAQLGSAYRVICVKMGVQRTMRLTVNDYELAKRGLTARIAKADGYFYFQFDEAANWMDRTIRVPTVNALTLKQWMDEHQQIKRLNAMLIKTKRVRKKTKA